MDEFWLPLMTISLTVSMVVSIVVCICRNKPKTTSSLNNGHNLLPLNSIRSSDLTTNLELIRYNGVNCVAAEDTDGHHRHTQRALPDIPLMANSLQHVPTNEFDLNRDAMEPMIDPKHSAEPKSRPLKARAPQPPGHRVLTCPTVPTDDDLHHSYARIKDNAVIDSSENETDDYCDPQLCSVRPVDHMTPPVPTKRFVNDLNNDLPFIASNPSTSRAGQELAYMSAPIGHHILHPNDDSFSQSSNDENRLNGNKSEISYNTISVREPLAKVLAERLANSEHHYNEVEEERVSSFYEEIAGSTASSVTYSKIGDILTNNHNNDHNINGNHVLRNSIRGTQDITNGSAVNSYPYDTTDSSSTQTQQSLANITPNCDSFLPNNYPKDLYSSVDKKSKSKSYNRQTIHCIPDSDNEFDNLYAKVQKQVNSSKTNAYYMNQRPSSVCDVDISLISDNSTPPPLPPPLKSFQTNQSRSARTISLYDSSNSATNSTTGSHQRRYSSGNQSINTSDWHNRDVDSDYFNYGIVGNNDMDLENDPGYEVIQRKRSHTPHASATTSTASHHNGIQSTSAADPGYEAIRYDESDFDPNYEVITKKVNTNTQINEIVDPGYEVIKRVPQIPIKTHLANHFELNISRNLSDVSSEPGYERIRFTPKVSTQIESEPNYAFITRAEEGLYGEVGGDDDEDDNQIITERL